MLSLILNTPPQAQLEARRVFGLNPFRLHASSALLTWLPSFLARRVGPLVHLPALDTCSSIRFFIGLLFGRFNSGRVPDVFKQVAGLRLFDVSMFFRGNTEFRIFATTRNSVSHGVPYFRVFGDFP
jgi:hypothetical protein